MQSKLWFLGVTLALALGACAHSEKKPAATPETERYEPAMPPPTEVPPPPPANDDDFHTIPENTSPPEKIPQGENEAQPLPPGTPPNQPANNQVSHPEPVF